MGARLPLIFQVSLLIILLPRQWENAFAQPDRGYYLRREVVLPDTAFTRDLQRLSIAPAFQDIRSNGMGRTRIADDRALTAFSYNPAFLARKSGTFQGTASVSATTPWQTVDAVVFLSNNQPEFSNGFSLRALRDAVEAYQQGIGLSDQVHAKLQKVASWTQDLFAKVVGDPANPDVHGANIDVSTQMRYGNWGFSLHAYGQSGMAVGVGTVLRDLLGIYLSTDFSDSTQAATALVELEGIMKQVVNPATGVVNPGVLPGIYALTYADIIATLGYGFNLVDSLSVGVNLKIVNRRFTANRIGVDDASDFTQKLFAGLNTMTTGVTADVGMLYRLPRGLTLGLNLQNVIPVNLGPLSSSYDLTYKSLQFQKDRDSLGNVIVQPNGDTALVLLEQMTNVHGPTKMSLPFVMNLGLSYRIHDDWDAALEVVDVAEQETRYKSIGERFGFGTEYRFHFFNDKLRLAPRVGFASAEATFGLGIGYADVVRLDAAYFTSTIVQARRLIAAQLTIAW